MQDIQGLADERGVAIDNVGVSDLKYPVLVPHPTMGRSATVGRFTMSVGLPASQKGTHLSRFIEALHEHEGELSIAYLPTFVEQLRKRLHAISARVEVGFDYFLERAAPVTRKTALMHYECMFVGEVGEKGQDIRFGVKVPVTTLCPCSKAISDYGAHNQRSYVTLLVRTTESPVSLDHLIDIIERSASCPVYPLLKRPDERHVTMQAYDNPTFAEDVVRNVAVQLREDKRIGWFRAHVENIESIHNHNAFSVIEWTRG
jgi:GTP cyclohydrolase I